VIVAAAHWYSSGTFWSVAGVLVAIAIGLPTLWLTRVPRQRLYYGAPAPTPLLARRPGGIDHLEIRHQGKILTDAYLLDVTLIARGRQDIPSSAFDQGRPLVFDLGARIVDILQVRCEPESSLSPPVTHRGCTLSVGPELIGRRQTITIAALVDGEPELTCTMPVLAQVSIQPRPEIDLANSRPWLTLYEAGIGVIAGLAVIVVTLATVLIWHL
jgi:hypothetical protein